MKVKSYDIILITSYVSKYSQKRPSVCAGVIDKMIWSFSRTAQMGAKKWWRHVFENIFVIIAEIDKGKL